MQEKKKSPQMAQINTDKKSPQILWMNEDFLVVLSKNNLFLIEIQNQQSVKSNWFFDFL